MCGRTFQVMAPADKAALLAGDVRANVLGHHAAGALAGGMRAE